MIWRKGWIHLVLQNRLSAIRYTVAYAARICINFVRQTTATTFTFPLYLFFFFYAYHTGSYMRMATRVLWIRIRLWINKDGQKEDNQERATPLITRTWYPFLPLSHRRRIYTEEKAKVVATVWGTEHIQFLAVLAVLHQDDLKKRMKSLFSLYHPGAEQLAR